MAWQNGLLDTMKDPASIVLKGERFVVIKDKYPKAKHHYLVIPHENIDTAFNLTKNDIDLVKEMEVMGRQVFKTVGQKEENFLMGFHAEPSMHRLHLHVISKDFIAPTLKTKSHWNSFTTPFLWPVSKIIKDLETTGRVQRLPLERSDELLKKPLQCNACPYLAKHMPDLKKHLVQHEALYL